MKPGYTKPAALLILLCVVMTAARSVRAQPPLLADDDSLLRQLPRARQDTNKVNLLVNISWSLDAAEAVKGLAYAKQALDLSRQLHWKKGIGLAQFAEGITYARQGRMAEAITGLDKSCRTFESVKDYRNVVRVMDKTAVVYFLMGQPEQAYALRNKIITLERIRGDKAGEAEALRLLGSDYVKVDNQDEALRYWLLAAQIKQDIGDTTGSEMFANIGIIYANRKDFRRSLFFYQKSLALSIARHNMALQAGDLLQIAGLHNVQYDYPTALKYYQESLQLLYKLNLHEEIARTEDRIGSVYAAIGDYDRALRRFFTALQIAEAYRDGNQAAVSLNNITIVYNAVGENRRAVDVLLRTLKIVTARRDTVSIPVIQANLGVVYTALDSIKQATYYFEQALAALNGSQQPNLSSALISYAELYQKTRKYPQALHLLHRALALATSTGDATNQSKSLGGIGRAYLALAQSRQPEVPPDSLSRYSAAQLTNKAVSMLSQAVATAQHDVNTADLPEFYRLLSEAQESAGDKGAALTSYKSYILYRDSILSTEKVKAVTRRDMQFDFERTQTAKQAAYDQQLAVSAERGRSGIRLAVISGISALLLLATGFYFQRKRSHDRYSMQILELKQEALNAQMSDHFIGNTMDSINGFITANDRANASRYLILFSRLIRRVLENATRKLVTVAEDLEVLSDYIALEKLRFSGDLQYDIQNPDNLPLDDILIPPMIFQTLAENAIKHGFNKATSGRLLIRLHRKSGMIECMVEDNGIGRSAAMRLKDPDGTLRKSFGTGIAEKLIRTGNKYVQEAACRVTDLLDQHNAPAGTRITFVLPYISAD